MKTDFSNGVSWYTDMNTVKQIKMAMEFTEPLPKKFFLTMAILFLRMFNLFNWPINRLMFWWRHPWSAIWI
jgi:hypothetical protein